MKNAFLHEKNIYFRLGKNKLKLYGGLQHYAVWGGSRPDFFKTNRSFSGWLDVVTGIEANDGSVVNGSNPNRPGDHRGIIEYGAEWENDDYKFQLIMKSAFGTREDLARKIAQLTPDAFAAHYPEPTGLLVMAYINGQSWSSFWDSLS